MHTKRPGAEEGKFDMDMTPMIDCTFLLLIFFMVTTVFSQTQLLKITLPRAKNFDLLDQKKLNVVISSDGQYDCNGMLVSRDELPGRLQEEKDKTGSASVIIRADEEASHGLVLEVMKMAAVAGIGKIDLAIEEEKKEKEEGAS
jgi:biopolymer transport protein ExbD